MDEKIKQYYSEILGSIFIVLLVIGCFLLWTVKYPSDFPGEAPIVFGLVDWLIILIFSALVFVGIYISYSKKKRFLSGLVMIVGGSLIFLYAIIKMACLEELFHEILYSHYNSYGVNFCNDNVRNWYYLIFIAFTGLILTGLWKIKRTYELEGKKSEIGMISFAVVLVALFCSFLPSFANVVDLWFISYDSLAFWYMGFAFIISIVAIKLGGVAYREYKHERKKRGILGLYSIIVGILSIVIDFVSFYILMVTSIVY